MYRAVTIVVLLIAATATVPADSVFWVAEGTRIENPAVLSLVLAPDLDTSMSAMVYLAKRDDQYVEDIIGPLLDQQSSQHEILLQSYLMTTWSSGELGLQNFVALNPLATKRLVGRLPQMKDGYLRGLVLLATRWVEHADRDSHIVSEAFRLAQDLETSPVRADLLFTLECLLDTASVINMPELGSALLDISRVVRHARLSRRARQIARSLLLGDDASH